MYRLWKMIYEFKITIDISQVWVPTSNFTRDKSIMEHAIKDCHYHGRNQYKLASLNQCRLSHCMDGNKGTVDKGYLDGSKKQEALLFLLLLLLYVDVSVAAVATFREENDAATDIDIVINPES